MSKKSCEAAESIKDALLRMARVNCNVYLDLKGFLSMILFKKFFAPIALLLCFHPVVVPDRLQRIFCAAVFQNRLLF